MKPLPSIITALFSLWFVPAALAADWQPAAGPLKTRWAKDVSPDHVLPEYPRPQMVRKDWLNLNGLWDIKLGDGTESKILVPFAIESALSGVMKHVDRVTYRRSFEIPKGWSGRQVLLHFGAVDWETKVTLNGKELGVHRGGYDAMQDLVQRKAGGDVFPTGAHAADVLGLSDQVPMLSWHLTTGPNRRIRSGKSEVVLRHVSLRFVSTKNPKSAQVILALRWIGKRGVDADVISKLRRNLSPTDRAALPADAASAPAWIATIFHRVAKDLPAAD